MLLPVPRVTPFVTPSATRETVSPHASTRTAQSGRYSASRHLLEGNRQVPYPSSGRMVDGVGDGGSDAHDAEVAARLAPEGRSAGVGDPKRDHLNVRNVRVSRN